MKIIRKNVDCLEIFQHDVWKWLEDYNFVIFIYRHLQRKELKSLQPTSTERSWKSSTASKVRNLSTLLPPAGENAAQWYLTLIWRLIWILTAETRNNLSPRDLDWSKTEGNKCNFCKKTKSLQLLSKLIEWNKIRHFFNCLKNPQNISSSVGCYSWKQTQVMMLGNQYPFSLMCFGNGRLGFCNKLL